VKVELVGVSTHLASADADDLAETVEQIECFNDTLEGETIDDLVVHIANTEGLARVSSAYEPFRNAMVRIGIGLYGCPIRPDSREVLGVEPVMTLRALVTNVKTVDVGTRISYGGRWIAERETIIATVGIGYADGYFRSLRGRATAGVNGTLRRVVGTICMDMIMIDLGPEASDVAVGDPVTLFGIGGPDVSEVAAWANTITYEITSALGTRVERRYD
jgi:alanine racemase